MSTFFVAIVPQIGAGFKSQGQIPGTKHSGPLAAVRVRTKTKEIVEAFRCIGPALEELELGPGASSLGCNAHQRWERLLVL